MSVGFCYPEFTGSVGFCYPEFTGSVGFCFPEFTGSAGFCFPEFSEGVGIYFPTYWLGVEQAEPKFLEVDSTRYAPLSTRSLSLSFSKLPATHCSLLPEF